MKRKRWTPQGEATPELLKVREKRRWQISLRRYVLEKNLCLAYAPYFGLDIENMRLWFEFQFNDELNWTNFGEKWQFDHIIPVTYFDFSNEEELKMCWNFTNLRVEHIKHGKDRGKRLDLIHAREYFREMYETTGFEICLKLLQKIDSIRLFANMVSKIKMGLKPLNHLQLANPFTEVNGNLCINFNFVNDLFPSA